MPARKFRVFILIAVGLLLPVRALQAATLLYDDFNVSPMDANLWHIPTWTADGDGTYIGRTQFRCTQNSPLPGVSESNAHITVESYNPTGCSFYGTDLISNQSFSAGQGVSIKVRAKIVAPAQAGTVGGIFLYMLAPESKSLHDEIDFELLGNSPGQISTNIYENAELGGGIPESYPYALGSVTDYHVYEIQWFPDRVKWLVDDAIIREDTSHIPAGPMAFHLNMWVPDWDWFEAYSDTIQPTCSPSENQVFTMDVDWVTIEAPPYASIEGHISTAEGTAICAMVLANGQYMFSCDGTGAYNLYVPLDSDGRITLFAFADGFAPSSVTLNASEYSLDVHMHTAAPTVPLISMTPDVTCASTPNWVHITGTIESFGGQPLCAMVLANGQHMFSCDMSFGRYDLTVPVDQNGKVTLFGFADGFQPQKHLFSAPKCP